MAYKDFVYRVEVFNDRPEIWKFCEETFKTGYWSKVYGVTDNSPRIYCFFYEQDATMFLLRWPNE